MFPLPEASSYLGSIHDLRVLLTNVAEEISHIPNDEALPGHSDCDPFATLYYDVKEDFEPRAPFQLTDMHKAHFQSRAKMLGLVPLEK